MKVIFYKNEQDLFNKVVKIMKPNNFTAFVLSVLDLINPSKEEEVELETKTERFIVQYRSKYKP